MVCCSACLHDGLHARLAYTIGCFGHERIGAAPPPDACSPAGACLYLDSARAPKERGGKGREGEREEEMKKLSV